MRATGLCPSRLQRATDDACSMLGMANINMIGAKAAGPARAPGPARTTCHLIVTQTEIT